MDGLAAASLELSCTLAEGSAVPIPPDAHLPGGGDQPPWLDQGRVPSINGLRGVAILLVVATHAAKTHGSPIPPNVWTVIGTDDLGSQLFLVLSGFLITLLFLRELRRERTIHVGQFYLRRACRLMPAYGVLLLTIWVLELLKLVDLGPRDWWGALTYTVNFTPSQARAWEVGHVYALSLQEQFYLVWPLLLLLLSWRNVRWFLMGCLVTAPLSRVFVWSLCRDVIDPFDVTTSRLDALAVGCALACLAATPHWYRRLRLDRRQGMALAGACLGILVVSKLLARSGTYAVACHPTVYALALGGITWAALHALNGPLGRLLECRLLVGIGGVSYSIYLWQQLFLNPHRGEWPCHWPLNLAFVALAALASYFLIESPSTHLKDALQRGWNRRGWTIGHWLARRASPRELVLSPPLPSAGAAAFPPDQPMKPVRP